MLSIYAKTFMTATRSTRPQPPVAETGLSRLRAPKDGTNPDRRA